MQAVLPLTHRLLRVGRSEYNPPVFLEVAPASELSGSAVFVYCVQVYNHTGEACPEAPPEFIEGRSRRDNGAQYTVMGREVVATITDRQLDCGLWEQISCGEFDGRCRKRVLVKLIGKWERVEERR